MEDKKDVKLSKGILEMKFMKKTKERVEKEEEDAEGRAMYANEITEEMRRTGNIAFVEASLAACLELVDGRLSFGGMNPELEKLMEADYKKQVGELERQKEKDVTDVEMAESYTTLVDTMGKKFQKQDKKLQNQDKKRKKKNFLKPTDD